MTPLPTARWLWKEGDRPYEDAYSATQMHAHAAKEAKHLRETLELIASHFDSSWPERCQSNVLAARHVLNAIAMEEQTP